jgi:hypothetical protein
MNIVITFFVGASKFPYAQPNLEEVNLHHDTKNIYMDIELLKYGF